MAITLDPAMEQRIQKQLSRGDLEEPAEILADALDLVEAAENWLLRNKEAIHAGLNESFAAAVRGEGYSLDDLETMFSERRASTEIQRQVDLIRA